MILKFVIQPLGKQHQRAHFDCGEESLNEFLQKYARQNSTKGFGRTFVAVLPDQSEVLGYYTLSSGSISFEIIPQSVPRYPIPTAHLGRLAVAHKMQGKRLGELLLIDALERTVLVSAELGVYAIELYALTENAKRFYLKYGFVPLQDDEKHLYLPIETLRKSGLV
jgi:GNAT superfamily N-acetyltransferase